MPGGVRALAAARLPCRKDGSAPDPLEPAAAGGGSGAPAQVPTPCHLATRQLRVRPWPVHVARRVLRLRLLLQPTPTPSNLLDSECRAVKTAETATVTVTVQTPAGAAPRSAGQASGETDAARPRLAGFACDSDGVDVSEESRPSAHELGCAPAPACPAAAARAVSGP